MAIYQSRFRLWAGLVLLVIGLLGHLLAAREMGGTSRAYIDHTLGFVLILVVSGAIVIGVGRRLWNGRFDVTLMTIGAIQAAVGITIYVLQAAA